MKKLSLLLCTILLLVVQDSQCNIWDNIFGNMDGPQIAFPNDFTMTLGTSELASQYNISIYYSAKFRSLKMQFFIEADQNLTKITGEIPILPSNKAGTLIFNVTNGTIFINDVRRRCVIVNSSLADSNSSLQTLTTTNLQMTSIWRFVSFYNGYDADTHLHKFDVTTLVSLVNQNQQTKIYAFFDDHQNLQFFEIYFDVQMIPQQVTLYVISPLTERHFEAEFFEIPESWDCTNEDTTEHLDFSDFTVQQILQQYSTYSNQDIFSSYNITELLNQTQIIGGSQ